MHWIVSKGLNPNSDSPTDTAAVHNINIMCLIWQLRQDLTKKVVTVMTTTAHITVE